MFMLLITLFSACVSILTAADTGAVASQKKAIKIPSSEMEKVSDLIEVEYEEGIDEDEKENEEVIAIEEEEIEEN